MKKLLYTILNFLLIITLLFSNPSVVLASEGDGDHGLEKEVGGYHVTLTSLNDWKKGENTIVVTLMDNIGMPVTDAEVEILIGAKSDEHAEPEAEPAHGAEEEHSAMPGMEHTPAEDSHTSAHEEAVPNTVSLRESDENGVYVTEAHFEGSGTHEINVMFHVNGEMLQADFMVDISGSGSKTIVLWSFVAINMILIGSAGMLKRQSILVKGRQ